MDPPYSWSSGHRRLDLQGGVRRLQAWVLLFFFSSMIYALEHLEPQKKAVFFTALKQLLSQEVIAPVSEEDRSRSLFWNLFTVPKWIRGIWPILTSKVSSSWRYKNSGWSNTVSDCFASSGDFLVSVDIKGAYLYILISLPSPMVSTIHRRALSLSVCDSLWACPRPHRVYQSIRSSSGAFESTIVGYPEDLFIKEQLAQKLTSNVQQMVYRSWKDLVESRTSSSQPWFQCNIWSTL